MKRTMYDVVRMTSYPAKEIMDKLVELNILTEQAKEQGWDVKYSINGLNEFQQVNVSISRDYWPDATSITE